MIKLVGEYRAGNGMFYQYIQQTTPVIIFKKGFQVKDMKGYVIVGFPYLGGN